MIKVLVGGIKIMCHLAYTLMEVGRFGWRSHSKNISGLETGITYYVITWLYRHFKKVSYSIALVVLLEWSTPVYAVSKGMYSI